MSIAIKGYGSAGNLVINGMGGTGGTHVHLHPKHFKRTKRQGILVADHVPARAKQKGVEVAWQ